jgi:aminoglycoside phosphotransferase (APT) family kinase protein
MLWKDGRMVAALDWELGFNGDPRWDLAYVLNQFQGPGGPGVPGLELPGMWQRDEIIRYWETGTGLALSDFGWFEAAGKAKGASILLYGYHLWTTGISKDERLSHWGVFGERAVENCKRSLALARAAA